MGTESKSTTTSEPFNGEARNFVYGDVMPQIRKRLQPYQGYTGQLNYGTTEGQTSGYNNLANAANNTGFINDAISGKNLDLSNNLTYQYNLQKAADLFKKQTGDAFANVNSSMNRGGLYDSSMRRNMFNRQADMASENLADLLANTTAQTFQNERTNQQNAYNAQQTALGNAFNAANYLQAQEQADVDRTKQNFMDTQGQEDKNLMMVVDFVNSIKNPSQESTTDTGGLRYLGK